MHGILKKRAIFADRASRGLKLERVYRELYEPEHTCRLTARYTVTGGP